MFDFPGADGIQSYKDDQQARLLASFNLDKAPLAQASLVKGISFEAFDSKYPTDKFERYTHASLAKAKDDFMKGEGAEADTFTKSTVGMTPVVVAKGERKALFYVRAKQA